MSSVFSIIEFAQLIVPYLLYLVYIIHILTPSSFYSEKMKAGTFSAPTFILPGTKHSAFYVLHSMLSVF